MASHVYSLLHRAVYTSRIKERKTLKTSENDGNSRIRARRYEKTFLTILSKFSDEKTVFSN